MYTKPKQQDKKVKHSYKKFRKTVFVLGEVTTSVLNTTMLYIYIWYLSCWKIKLWMTSIYVTTRSKRKTEQPKLTKSLTNALSLSHTYTKQNKL